MMVIEGEKRVVRYLDLVRSHVDELIRFRCKPGDTVEWDCSLVPPNSYPYSIEPIDPHEGYPPDEEPQIFVYITLLRQRYDLPDRALWKFTTSWAMGAFSWDNFFQDFHYWFDVEFENMELAAMEVVLENESDDEDDD